MAPLPVEVTLELTPSARLDVIDVSRRLEEECGNPVSAFPRALYISYHTTAGYFDQGTCAELDHDPDSLQSLVRAYKRVFPPEAGYQHDLLHLRAELSEEQRGVEPRNADSHLAFIGAGLTSCATYEHRPGTPVWFVDLDGVCGDQPRRRQTTVIGYHREEEVARVPLAVPVSERAIDSVNLKDARLGLFDQLGELLARYGIGKGRVDLTLDPGEQEAGLTVNEYETLLMTHDLAEVLADPLRHLSEKGKYMLRHPRAIPGRTIEYAKYDGVRVLNELLEAMGIGRSIVERVVRLVFAVPASHFLRMKRSVSLAVADRETPGSGAIVHGIYQTPILIQWNKAVSGARQVEARLVRFE